MASVRGKILVDSSKQIKRGVFLCIPWGGQPGVTEIVVVVTQVLREKGVFKIRFLSDGQVYHKEFSLDPAQLRTDEGLIYVVTKPAAQIFLRGCIKKQQAAVKGIVIDLARAETALLDTVSRLAKLC